MDLNSLINKIISEPGSAFFYTPSFYEESKSYLFLNPDLTITAGKEKFSDALNEVDNCINKGLSGFGLIDYEAGYLLEKKLEKLLPDISQTLLRFFFFDKSHVEVIDSGLIEFFQNDLENKFEIRDFKLNITKEVFTNTIQKIRNYIAEGDTYQVNYTIKGKFGFEGDLLSFFQRLIFNQSAKYSAFINAGDSYIISLSPELFFSAENHYLKTRPMKGTQQRGYNKADDSLAEYSLSNSEKNRAENLMIVDLLRNDMGKISEFGSVRLRKLFQVERYESLLQMTSEIESEFKGNITFSDIIKNIFPSGSVTGAPKISTMKIINELEKEERGIYTGTIGFIHNNKKIFNVAIRTIALKKNEIGKHIGEVGLGSGIVWDSNAEQEYKEVLLKSNFFLKPYPYFELIETMKCSNGEVENLDLHLIRLKDSASYFLFKYDEKFILNSLKGEIEKRVAAAGDYKIRLLLNKWGKVKIEISDLPSPPDEIKIIISDKIIYSENRFQYFKTTNREMYNSEYKKYSEQGFFDVIFINEKNQVAEGSIANIFINKNGLLYTPPVSSGVLPGVFRKYWMLRNINIKEENLYKDDLLIADEIILTNSVRGKVKVDKLYLNETEFIEFSSLQKNSH